MNDLIQQAQQLQMEYTPFQFPLKASEKGIIFRYVDPTNSEVQPFETELLLSRDGMTLLLQNLYTYVNRSKAKAHYNTKEFDTFVAYINQCRAQQENDDLWRKGQTYLAAVNRGVVYGVIVNYNPKSNSDVIQDIADNKLDQTLKRGYVSSKEMNLYLAHHIKDGFEIGLHVRNGETGYATLSYRLYVRQNKGEYTFSTPTFGRRKHLSKLAEVDDNLRDLYSEINDIGINEFILTTESKEFAQLILQDEKLEKIHDLVEPYDSRLKKLYILLGVLGTQRSVRGYKGVCTKALDLIYEKIMEKL